jgi:hypothetical protein
VAALSEWLQLMLAEIARKREDCERARDEEVKRVLEQQVSPRPAAGSTAAPSSKLRTSGTVAD